MLNSDEILPDYLRNNDYAVSIGGLGAIAEYEGSPITVRDEKSSLILSSKNDHGALKATIVKNATCFAREYLSSNNRLWNQELVVADTTEKMRPKADDILQEIGPDENALSRKERSLLLFNLGTGLSNSNFCIRTGNRQLIAVLRHYVGRRIISPNHPVIESIIDASPTRVVISKIGRIEVYQEISRLKTPSGPHTHLLPHLLDDRRTHSRTLALPSSAIPVLSFHPKRISRHNPEGTRSCRQFDMLLKRFGDQDYFSAKRRAILQLRRNMPPSDLHSYRSSVEKSALRIALIQSKYYFPSGKLASDCLAELNI